MTFSHDEPVRGGYLPVEMLALSGEQRMNAGRDGFMPLPPINHLFGLTPVATDTGQSTFAMPATPWLQTRAGFFLGGVSALVCDAPLGGAILSKVPARVFGVTSELSMSYLRPATVASKQLISHAQIIDVGRSVGLSQAVVEDINGNLLAHATSRYFLTRLPDDMKLAEPKRVEQVSYDQPDPYQRAVPASLLEPMDWARVSGLDYFQTAAKTSEPQSPIDALMGWRTREASDGEITMSMRASEWLNSPARATYGGVLALYADAVMTAAVTTTLPAGSSCATLDMKMHFLRPSHADGREIAGIGTVVHRGRSLAVTRAELVNEDGKQIAIATGSFMVLEGRPWQTISVADEAHDDDG